MRIVMCTMGTRGDVQPMIALACALRGKHHVSLCTSHNFREFVEAAGVTFCPMGDDTQSWLTDPANTMGKSPFSLARPMLAWARAQVPIQFRDSLAACAEADLLIGAGVYVAGPSVAAARKLPYVNVSFTPTLFPSDTHPPVLMPWQELPPWANRMAWWLSGHAFDFVFKDTLNACRQELGLRPVQSVFSHMAEGTHLVAADGLLAPKSARHSSAHQTGFWHWDEPSDALPPHVEAFVQAGPPPVYVGFGSMVPRDAARTTQHIVGATRAAGLRLLLSSGWAGLGKGLQQAPDVLVVPALPHRALFPRMAAVVHHGGAGTTAAATRAGVPQVVVPHLLDQFYWAHRLHALNLAPAPIDATALTATTLDTALQRALHSPEMARVRAVMAARLRQTQGLATAARLVESLDPARRAPAARPDYGRAS